MKLDYTANHVLRFDLDEPFVYNNREVDRIRIEIMWVDVEDDQPEGWWVTSEFYGWPLTAKGTRDKRIKDRERAYHLDHLPYPHAQQAVVWDAWDATVARTGIDSAMIVNPDEGLFSERVWEKQN